jgi:nitrogen regulatory protein PII
MREFHHSRVLHSFDVSASRLCLWPPFMRHPRHKATSQIPEIYRGTEFAVIFLPKIKVEVMVPASLVDAIVKAARMGQIGDGKIFVASINRAMSIRTVDTAGAAL